MLWVAISLWHAGSWVPGQSASGQKLTSGRTAKLVKYIGTPYSYGYAACDANNACQTMVLGLSAH